jgi:hypothetical protein
MKFSETTWVALAILAMGLPGFSQQRPADMPQIALSVYNDARVPERVLAKAQRQATRIFSQAGVKLVWIACSPSRRQGASDPACVNRMGGSHLAVRILPWSSTSGGAVFGVAFLSPEGHGAYSDVFYDSVEKLHEGWHIDIATLLAHVIAHEVGHLLLGEHAHAEFGIMRPKWQGEELRSIAMGGLLFTPSQIESFKVRLSTLQK